MPLKEKEMNRRWRGYLGAALFTLTTVAAHAADPAKVLRVAFQTDVTGFDPQVASDVYSARICRAIFDSLLAIRLPRTPLRAQAVDRQALPEIRDGGRTLVFKLKPGIYFTPDPAFKGKPRELVAEDYVYSWKRLIDPRMRSFWSFLLDGNLAGADEVVAVAKANGRFDYDAKLEGLLALDRYTLQIKLKQPDYVLLEFMTTTVMAAVAREIVEAHGSPANGWTMDHPVGTGPFTLKEWRRGSKVVLAANSGYRDERFPSQFDSSEDASVRANAAKRLPLVGQVEVNIVEEGNPRLLAFDAQQIDYLHVPYNLVDRVLENGSLRSEYARRGVKWTRVLESAFTYTYFNMDDPVVGGYTPERVALRRAIAMAYDVDNEIRVLRQGQAIPATQIIPPGLLGHDPTRNRRADYDPAAARALLDKFGYKVLGPGGYRTRPDGSPLVLKLGSPPDSESREFDELWKRSMDAVGIRIEFVKQKWPDLLKMSTCGPAADVPARTLDHTARRWRRAGDPLRQEYRQRHERRSLQPAGVRSSLRAIAGSAGQSRAHAPLREDVRARGRVHAADARHVSVPQRAGAALAARLQPRPVLSRTMEVPRHRRRAAEGAH